MTAPQFMDSEAHIALMQCLHVTDFLGLDCQFAPMQSCAALIAQGK